MQGFHFYLMGAEVSTWRKLLASEGIHHVGINWQYLQPQLVRRKSPWRIADYFEGQKVLLDSGAASISKKGWDPDEHEEYLAGYVEFVAANLDALTYVVEADFTDMPYDWVEAQRRVFWDKVPPQKFIPVWHEEWGDLALRDMLDHYPNLGVPPLSDVIQNRLSGPVRSSGAKLHGLCFNHPYNVPNGVYSTILSTSWISPMKYGETQIWDHNRIRRYSADQKEQARRRHRHQIVEAGFDPDLFDVPKESELARYTIWAWKKMEEQLQPPKRTKRIVLRAPAPAPQEGSIATNGHTTPPLIRPSRPTTSVDNDVSRVLGNVSGSNGHRAPLPDVRRDLKVMPGFGFRMVETTVKSQVEGEKDIVVRQRVPALIDESGRMCSSCSLASRCPEFQAGASCAFSFPVEIRTRDQLLGTMNTFLEMQARRVAFTQMSEATNGGYPDPNLSMEIDRFYRIIETMKKIQEDPSMFKLSVEGQGDGARAAAGMLSRIFGQKATEPIRLVDTTAAEEALRDVL